jgi:hypothetical protein
MPDGRAAKVGRLLHGLGREVSCLADDLSCRPFSENGPLGLVVAVDWSEVHAYIFGGPPPRHDPLCEVAEPHVAQAAHQLALSVLFDRLPDLQVPVFLLPPYVNEMAHFGCVVQSEGLALDVDLAEREALLSPLRGLDAVGELRDLCLATPESLSPEAKFEHFRSRLSEIDEQRVLDWVESAFGGLFLLARLSDLRVLDALQHLIECRSDLGRRLGTLADVNSSVASQFRLYRPDRAEWQSQLSQKHASGLPGSLTEALRKPTGALRRDAEAMAWLACLNSIFHANGQQLIFATRSRDIAHVMDEHAGLFASLGDHHYHGTSGAPTPTIWRTWHYFFELGLALTTAPHAPATVARKQLTAIQSKSEVLNRAKHRSARAMAIQRKLTQDLGEHIHNMRAFLSAERPWLPIGQSVSDEALASRLFVAYVTDPAEFQKQRKMILTTLRDRMREVQWQLPLLRSESPLLDSFDAPHIPLAKAFIEKFDLALLLSDVETPNLRSRYRGLFRYMKSGPNSAVLESVSHVAADLERVRSAQLTGPGEADVAYLALLAVYATGAFPRLMSLLDDLKPVRERVRPLTARWVLDKLMYADARVVQRAPDRANAALRKAWRDAQAHSTSSRGPALAATWLLYARLVLHLHWTEEKGENLLAFPVDPDDPDRLELESIADETDLWLRRPHVVKSLPSTLVRSLTNKWIYAIARLIPVVEGPPIVAGVRSHSARRARELLDNARSGARVAYLIQQPRMKAEEYDTLGYYYLKRAYWEGMVTPVAREHAKNSRDNFAKARRGKRHTFDRTWEAATAHVSLLDSLEWLAKSSTERWRDH